nr:hypothetical protein [Abalone asfa-like virus]
MEALDDYTCQILEEAHAEKIVIHASNFRATPKYTQLYELFLGGMICGKIFLKIQGEWTEIYDISDFSCYDVAIIIRGLAESDQIKIRKENSTIYLAPPLSKKNLHQFRGFIEDNI